MLDNTGRPSVTRARKTPGDQLADNLAQPDMRRLRGYRLARVRAQLKKFDYAGCLLFDPINIRYATGSRNMAVWTLHNAARYCFIATEGPVVIFDYHNSGHLAEGLETVDEIRKAVSWFFFGAGPKYREKAELWAAEIADLVAIHGGGNRRLALDHCDFTGVNALSALGIEVCDAQEPMEYAREIKSDDELACMNLAISVCEAGMARMKDAIRAGRTENEIWSKLHEVNIAMGGEWIETRLLSSGGRTNPWFQESSDRIVRPGELVSYDTDLIGPFGYCADISRSHFCGPGRPSDEQRRLYQLAWEQIHHNIDLIKAGLTFREFAERAWVIPETCRENRYGSLAHGVGLCDEWPRLTHLDMIEAGGNDGVLEAGMTICVESYIGEVGGDEGVKLEQQVLVTDNGVELLSTFPFDEELLLREV
jgi:Xaa-Pro aminopeptidase